MLLTGETRGNEALLARFGCRSGPGRIPGCGVQPRARLARACRAPQWLGRRRLRRCPPYGRRLSLAWSPAPGHGESSLCTAGIWGAIAVGLRLATRCGRT